MQAIILAAGIGSRLRPIVYTRPKPLTQVANTRIIFHSINALVSSGVNDIIIVAGYKKDILIREIEEQFPNSNIKFVINDDYETTNNSYSLYLAKEFLDSDTFVLNADVIFDAEVISSLIKEKNSCFAIDTSQYMEESMKVQVEGGLVTNISKEITEDAAHGCSIDVYKFNAKDSKSIKQALIETVETKNKKMLWTEVILDELCREQTIQVSPVAIGNARWVEIDNLSDLVLADEVFNPFLKQIADKRVFFLDNDGTLSLNNQLIPGAIELIEMLKKKGKKFYILTNNSSKTKFQHAAGLKKLGLNLEADDVLVSLDSCIAHLQANKINKIFALASKDILDYLAECGFELCAKHPQRLILTYDRELTYPKLAEFIELVNRDIPYYATHLDKLYPTPKGFLPDIGLTIGMIEECTGISPSRVFGKPDYNFIKPVLDKHNLKAQDALIVGDRLYTDIRLATENNIFSVAVLSGETKREDCENVDFRANLILNSVKDLVEYI